MGGGGKVMVKADPKEKNSIKPKKGVPPLFTKFYKMNSLHKTFGKPFQTLPLGFQPLCIFGYNPHSGKDLKTFFLFL